MFRFTPRLTAFALAAALALSLAACGQEQGASPTAQTPTATEQAPETTPSATADAAADTEWYDEEERTALGDTQTEWIAGWFVPEALDDPGVADLEIRYRKAPGLTAASSAFDRAKAAFAALETGGPVELINALEGVPLPLFSATVDDRDGAATAVLDFGEGLPVTNQMGSAGGQAAEVQFHAMVTEYFPDAERVLITIEGSPAGELFHGKSYDEAVPLAR